MTEPTGPFAVNGEDVAAKVIDGELIVIRLSDGTYYSMDNVGTRVWELIAGHHEAPDVIRTVAEWFGVPVERVRHDVEPLIRELLDEGLVIAAADAAPPPVAAMRPADLPPYDAPRLNVYRDMGNLLALDPPTPGIDAMMFKADEDN
jgi:hypothetical protein